MWARSHDWLAAFYMLIKIPNNHNCILVSLNNTQEETVLVRSDVGIQNQVIMLFSYEILPLIKGELVLLVYLQLIETSEYFTVYTI